MRKLFIYFLVPVFFIVNASAASELLINSILSSPELQASSQAIVILGEDPDKPSGQVFLYEKDKGVWTALSGGFPAVAGKKGFAAIGEKREGDGKSPSGIFTLSLAFGYAPSCNTKMPYRQATADDFWVDDPESPQYNTWVKGKPEAKSFEKMLRKDILYKWGVVVDYNTNPVKPGMGSAIFLHVWRKADSITVGCAAFSEENILRLLKWLDPGKKPVVIMGTAQEIQKLVK